VASLEIAALPRRVIFALGLSATAAQSGAAQAVATAVPPVGASAPSATTETVIARGTEITLLTAVTLSSEANAKGDLIHMTVARDVLVDGRIVIPVGAAAVGELTRAERKGAFGASGKLEARMLYVTVGDRTYRLGGVIGVKGRGGTTEAIATGLAVGTLAFVVTGRRAEIPAGTAVTAYFDRDVRVDP
jgi:hypothetical protein